MWIWPSADPVVSAVGIRLGAVGAACGLLHLGCSLWRATGPIGILWQLMHLTESLQQDVQKRLL